MANGFLEGNNLEELIEVYMGDLVGDANFEKYGNEFPLLIKLIDARDVLSLQVHPDDKLARERHHAYGKTEMWYILQKEEDSKIYTGFKKGIDKEKYLEAVKEKKLPEIMNIIDAEEGDVFFIPAGRVHAIGKGLILAEIQQTSDVTYRIYDWERTGLDGKPRELHTDLSVDAIDFSVPDSYKTNFKPIKNQPVNLVDCSYFTTNILELDAEITRDYSLTDSFIILLCTKGGYKLKWDKEIMSVSQGETILIPALMDTLDLVPEGQCCLLEVYC